ncbi:hypothetical protein SFRURICE_013608 [Spodoptera frugiperda]|nr:hypothetical protein SFRURICE_013608 [Spodoptera frugiperda]
MGIANQFKIFFSNVAHIRIFFCVVGGCVNKHTISHAHDTQTRNNNLWIIQKVAPCRNRNRYTLHGSQLPSRRANHSVPYTTEKFSKNRKKLSCTLPDLGIETPCSSVAIATTRPTRQSLTLANICIFFYKNTYTSEPLSLGTISGR